MFYRGEVVAFVEPAHVRAVTVIEVESHGCIISYECMGEAMRHFVYNYSLKKIAGAETPSSTMKRAMSHGAIPAGRNLQDKRWPAPSEGDGKH